MKRENIKTIFKIAKNELYSLFYSPIAWITLILFTVQLAMPYVEFLMGYLNSIVHNYPIRPGLTSSMYFSKNGILTNLMPKIHLYIPLVSMGLMSREYSSGSIKLLFSSPISNTSIIIGKYISTMAFSLCLMLIMFVFILHSSTVINDFDWSIVFCGLLGVFLVLSTYFAIGLFMSTLTSYQLVAAIGTLGVIYLFNTVSGIGQDINVVRDITYWFNIDSKTSVFMKGVLSSEAIIYFITIIALFLYLSITKLDNSRRTKSKRLVVSKYIAVALVVMSISYLSSNHKLKVLADVTHTKQNSLSDLSKEALIKLGDKITITTYVNIYDNHFDRFAPNNQRRDKELFDKYLDVNPNIEFKYVYFAHEGIQQTDLEAYLDTKTTFETKYKRITVGYSMDESSVLSAEEIEKKIDLSSEGWRTVRVITNESGKSEVSRFYDDARVISTDTELLATLNRFSTPAVNIAIVNSLGTKATGLGLKGYNDVLDNKTSRKSLVNLGFNVTNVDIVNSDIPANTDILILSDVKENMPQSVSDKIIEYLEMGGNMLFMSDIGRAENTTLISDYLGINFSDNILVMPSSGAGADVLKLSHVEGGTAKYSMPKALAVDYGYAMSKFEVEKVLVTPSTGAWVEHETTDFEINQTLLNPYAGESEGEYTTLVRLSREKNNKQQSILVSGDSDFFTNGELLASRNFRPNNHGLIIREIKWLADNKYPINIFNARDIDDSVNDVTEQMVNRNKILFRIIMPLAILIAGLLLIIRRKKA